MKGVTVNLSVKDGCEPVFYKPVRDKVSGLVKDGVVEKFLYSDWATPIVAIQNPM